MPKNRHAANNPVSGKIAAVHECLQQLHQGLPDTESEYMTADRLTHAYVKSCFLMIIQRIADINTAIIAFCFNQHPKYSRHKHYGFRIMQQHGAIDKSTVSFFQSALGHYRTIANPYEELPPSEMYKVSQMLLEQGKSYIQQIERFFEKRSEKNMNPGVLEQN